MNWGLLLSSILVFTSCTKLSKTANTSASSSSVSAASQSTSGNFVLSQVLPSQDTAGAYDLIGQSNQFDTYCGGTNACSCNYTYLQAGVSQTTQVAPVYQESNLITCPNQAPSGISSIDVSITTAGNANSSNIITVNLNSGTFAGSTLYLDLTARASYVLAQRFQCRKHEFIPNPMDSQIIDPFQAENPAVIYPFNYYTTNISDSLLQMQQLSNQNYECTLVANQDQSVQWWANPNVFSTAPCADSFCSGDGQLMYPQSSLTSGLIPVNNGAQTGKRRGSFWLAKQPYGVFQTALQAAVAPGATPYVSATYGVIGYAAQPVPNSNGSSSCPAIALPPNATWVKLWNFRATDITAPKYVTGSFATAQSAIACNPGDGTFQSCDNWSGGHSDGSQSVHSLSNRDSVSGLASRVAALSGGNNANACYDVQASSWANGNELWQPSNVVFGNPSPAPGTTGGLNLAQVQTLPWNMYSSLAQICQGKNSSIVYFGITGQNCPADPSGSVLPNATPYDSQITTTSLSADNYTDQLFVVSSPTVNDGAMTTQSSSVAQYRPITFRTQSACPGTTPGGCPSNSAIHWDINVSAVGNQNSGTVFPLCVVQFYD